MTEGNDAMLNDHDAELVWLCDDDFELLETEDEPRPARPLSESAEVCLATLVRHFLQGDRMVLLASLNGHDIGVFSTAPDGPDAETAFMDGFAHGLATWAKLGWLNEEGANHVELLLNRPCTEAIAAELITFKLDHEAVIDTLTIRIAQVPVGLSCREAPVGGLHKLWDAACFGIRVGFTDPTDAATGELYADASDHLAQRAHQAAQAQAQTVGLTDARRQQLQGMGLRVLDAPMSLGF
jgi:hypothetical protein